MDVCIRSSSICYKYQALSYKRLVYLEYKLLNISIQFDVPKKKKHWVLTRIITEESLVFDQPLAHVSIEVKLIQTKIPKSL